MVWGVPARLWGSIKVLGFGVWGVPARLRGSIKVLGFGVWGVPARLWGSIKILVPPSVVVLAYRFRAAKTWFRV
jgi:hypothetical protein